jgi:hypothetical protein
MAIHFTLMGDTHKAIKKGPKIQWTGTATGKINVILFRFGDRAFSCASPVQAPTKWILKNDDLI